MPVDCVAFEQRYCIPSQYAGAIELGGIYRLVDKDGRPVEVYPEAVRRIGAHINLRQTDAFSPTPLAGMAVRGFAERSLYYAYSCTGLTCIMRMALVLPEVGTRAERCGTFVSDFVVTGTNAEGLQRALKAIRLRIPYVPEESWPTLASFKPHVQPPVKFATDCKPREWVPAAAR